MSTAPAKPLSSGWIIAPAWDLLFFVLTPAIILPAVWAGERVFSAEQIWLVAISFFSVGHHLPGFLRAYGDRELFDRFRWRLILVPPAILATAWWCESQQLHGLRVLVLLWATWHGLMQTYGFMRIYDLKRGIRDAWSARLDFWLCLGLFAVGVVWSEPRLFGLLQAIYDAGAPVVSVDAIRAVQWGIAAGTAAVALAWLGNLSLRAARGQPVSWLKAALALSTAAIWWICGATPNTLVGVAMFEIYHAVQYLAIVWVFHQGALAGRSHSSRWLLLFAYLGLIAAFGGIRYGLADQVQAVWLSALLATSTLLHYYYDGFIWKVRERSNQARLQVDGAGKANSPTATAPLWLGWMHAAKWGVVGLLLAGLWQLERGSADASPTARLARRQEVTAALAAAAPHLADAQRLAADAALDAGELGAARLAAEQAVQLDPHSAAAQGTLGHVLLALGDRKGALDAYRAAAVAAPTSSDHVFNLAGALADGGEFATAEMAYQQSLQLAPPEGVQRIDIQRDLAQLYLRWSAGLCDAGDHRQAIQRLRLAGAFAAQPAQQRSIADLAAILALTPGNRSPEAEAVRGAVAAGDWVAAPAALGVLAGAKLPAGMAATALGAALARQDREGEALAAYQAALAANPHDGQAHLAVGRILWDRAAVEQTLALPSFGPSSAERAREHLRHAIRAGEQLPPELREALE